MRGRRFLAYSVGRWPRSRPPVGWSGGSMGAAPTRIERSRWGAIRGTPGSVLGPRGSRLYTERFPAGRSGAMGTVILTHGYCLTEAVWH